FYYRTRKEKRMMQLQEIVDGLLWPIWRGVPPAYKKKYSRTIWEQFENQIRSSAYSFNGAAIS
ncbi:hypothetical protein, partial [Chthonomonas sp.]|uniref:hypothetical protein n=1 Tax=Chthonomonas sp. TaxID=2282153 RepID=UPI0039C87CBF